MSGAGTEGLATLHSHQLLPTSVVLSEEMKQSMARATHGTNTASKPALGGAAAALCSHRKLPELK